MKSLFGITLAVFAVLAAPLFFASAPPQPSALINYNDQFATTSEQLAAKAGVKIGDYEWSRHGDYLTPEDTGTHFAEGWNRSYLFADAGKLERAMWIALSNIHARPHAYPFAPVRMVGYKLAERPITWTWIPGGRDTMLGGLTVGGAIAYGSDSEHPNYEVAFSGAELPTTFPLSGICTRMGAPLQMDTRTWMIVGVQLVQWSMVGEVRAWANNKLSTGIPARAPDRVTHRLLYALTRCAQIVGFSGQDAIDATAWLEAEYAQELKDGPSVQTTKEITTIPQVGLPWVTGADGLPHLSLATNPYFNPVQSYGYGIPAWYWADKVSGTTAHIELVKKWCGALVAIVGDDGSMPWAIDKSGVIGYFDANNGDKYTASFEVYAALRIADSLDFAGAPKKAQAILDRWKAMPAGEIKEKQQGYFVDANRKPAW
jgi:hypothetical protein